MYTYYAIRVVLRDGDWGYAQAGHTLTKDVNAAAFFDTREEAESWYWKYIRDTTYHGVSVDRMSSTISTCSSAYPL